MTEIHVDRDDMVATVTISHPGTRNAVSGRGWAKLLDVFDDLAYDESVRCVVVTGDGDDFCSGAYVGPRRDRASEQAERSGLLTMRLVGRCCETLFDLPKPTIARVDGVAAGAGLNLALACDFVLASDRSRFSEIFARRGLNVDFGGSFLLPRIVGMQKAKELVLLADVIDAERAGEMGLVNRVVPRGKLDAIVSEFAGKLVAGPPIALSVSKRLLNQSFTSTIAEAVDAEGLGQNLAYATSDVAEAAAAFVEKRTPRFTGR